VFGVDRLVPAGVFYVNLRGRPERVANRQAALAEPQEAQKRAYRHAGRFDEQALPQLDARADAESGDQFAYRRKKNGDLQKRPGEWLGTPEFRALLDGVDNQLKRMGREIFDGEAAVSPFRGSSVEACQTCDYASVCRIDRWTHTFRTPPHEPGLTDFEAETMKQEATP
jgi:ATP-dependent helicase/DNAse subunit B